LSLAFAAWLVIWVLWALLWLQNATLDVYATGILQKHPSSWFVLGRWDDFADSGRINRVGVDGLRLKQPILAHFAGRGVKTRAGGIPLENYERHWRSGDIGRCIRLYAPHLVGIEPRDAEGGSTLS
jgi:hypothetical protein